MPSLFCMSTMGAYLPLRYFSSFDQLKSLLIQSLREKPISYIVNEIVHRFPTITKFKIDTAQVTFLETPNKSVGQICLSKRKTSLISDSRGSCLFSYFLVRKMRTFAAVSKRDELYRPF